MSFDERWAELHAKLNAVAEEMAQLALEEYGTEPIPASKHTAIMQVLQGVPQSPTDTEVWLYHPVTTKLVRPNVFLARKLKYTTADRRDPGPWVTVYVGVGTSE